MDSNLGVLDFQTNPCVDVNDMNVCNVKSHSALHQCQVSHCYLSVTRNYCFPTSFDYIFIYIVYIYMYCLYKYVLTFNVL